jgi:lipid-binding SYLF domain-containing protein
MKTKFIALVSATALAIGSITGCSTTSKPPDDTPAQKRQNLDAAVDAALAQLYAQDPASRELVAKSRGVLVFPSIVTAGFVIGGSYGQGALRVAGKRPSITRRPRVRSAFSPVASRRRCTSSS